MSARPLPNRQLQIAKIHIAKKDLGLSDEIYQDILFTVTRFRSCSDIDDAGLQKVLDHLAARGWRPRPGKAKVLKLHQKVTEEKKRLVWRIEQWLAAAVPARTLDYVEAIAKKRFHVERLGWCTPKQLHKILAMLEIDGKRHGWTIDKGADHATQ